MIAEILIGLNPKPLYLDYAPSGGPKYHNYESFLNRLGFLPARDSKLAHDMRKEFMAAFKQCTHQPIRAFLLKKDNEAAFKALILGFLKETGPKFWGTSNRDHLEAPDNLRGFLYPRDADREGSR